MDATNTTTTAHPFAVFGPAPYRFVRFEDSAAREAEQAARRAAGHAYTTNLCGGSCDLCGTAIWNVYTFEAANGRRFKVGCDCAEKAGEGHTAKEGRKAQERAQREAAYAVKRAERLEAERDANEAEGFGRVTNDEKWAAIAAEREAIEAAKKAASQHFGTPGERIKDLVLRLEGSYSFDTIYGGKTLYFLRTLDGNAVLWGTTSGLRIGREGDAPDLGVGGCFRCSATVKRHGEYKGQKQTEITRLRWLA